MPKIPLALLLTLSCTTALAGPHQISPAEPVIRAYYDDWMKVHPLGATSAGFHAYDDRLPDLSVAAETAWMRKLDEARSAMIGARALPGCAARCQTDLRVMVVYIDRELFELREMRSIERYPDAVIGIVSNSVFPLVKRNFAPLDARGASVIARLDKVPALIAMAKVRLLGTDRARLRSGLLVSKAGIHIALEELDGAASFVGDDVPLAFVSLPDVQARVRRSADTAVAAMREYGRFLGELEGRAMAPIALGERMLQRKLHHDEMIDQPIGPLLARGEAELHRLQALFVDTAHKIDPAKTAVQVEADLGRDHPTADKLLDEVRARLAGLRRFVVDHKLASVRSEAMPIVEETPPFMRATTQASMDTPGAYEQHATESFYNVTLPDPHWPPARIESLLSGAFNRARLDTVSIHEAFPGHYVQFLWEPYLDGMSRRMDGVASNAEGWAHYCEQMMLDEGWANGDPRVRLAQLGDALLRAARYVVAIRMHARGMSMPEAERFFVEQGYQSEEVARIETKRAIEDPTYLYYTWGKLEILKLRDELQRAWGGDFTLQRFHDEFLAQGPIPLPILREALLPKP